MTTTRKAINRQSGVVLVMALILLVAMTLLALGLTRSADTAVQVANNIAFKQATIHSSDSGIEQAIVTLRDSVADKLQDDAAKGYYATEQGSLDITGTMTPADTSDDVDWTGTGESGARAKVGTSVDGDKIAYVIHRMCAKPGKLQAANDNTANSCATSSGTSSAGNSKGGGQVNITSKTQMYYRITVRTEGARNTVSYVQSMVLLEY